MRTTTAGDEPLPRRGRRSALFALVVVVVAIGAVLALARLDQLDGVVRRLEHASPGLLGLAVACEVLSFAGYVVLVRIVFRPVAPRISWSASAQITLAGVVATRLLTAGGVGGIALTVWALRAAGLDSRAAARRLGALLVVLYAIFFAALALAGAAAATGALGGHAPLGLGLAGAGVGTVVIGLGLAALLAPAPAFARESVRLALDLVRAQRGVLLAAGAWWAFDIGVLWTTFQIFGSPPPLVVLVLCYFLGQLAQAIPLPGGVGPVEAGMVGAFAASGVALDLAVLAVLAYRAVSTWLPALPGVWAYLKLRGTVARWRAGDRLARADASRGSGSRVAGLSPARGRTARRAAPRSQSRRQPRRRLARRRPLR